MFVGVAQKTHACSKPFRVTCGPTLPCARRITTSATDRGEYRQAAGVFAEVVTRSVELIVQPDAHDVVGEMGVGGHISG
jgi:hypothetical protein